ncbi:MAG: hypothetical protein RXO24_04845 [Acidilobus sp.]
MSLSDDKRKVAERALRRVEGLYYSSRIDKVDAYFIALGVIWAIKSLCGPTT